MGRFSRALGGVVVVQKWGNCELPARSAAGYFKLLNQSAEFAGMPGKLFTSRVREQD